VKKQAKWGLAVVVILFVAIQFWPVSRTNPPVTSDLQAPPDVKAILHDACYNCHSNETKWPWYSHVAPASWMLAHDVHHARSMFNLSNWGSIPPNERQVIMRHMWKQVESGGMPLLMYRLAHPEARLSESQKNTLKEWATTTAPQ
jgi:hypothetical protein